jgi:hypothetical protein
MEANIKEKKKWISVLDTLPIFVMIYDKAKDSIRHVNNHFKSVFFPTYY